MFSRLWNRLRARVGGRDLEGELDDEIRFHVEMQTARNVAAGMTPERARREALTLFGGIDQTKEAVRDQRHTPLDSIRQDLHYAARTLRHSPTFTLVAIFTLAIGIGANTAIFTLVDAVLFRPLPYRDPGRLVWLMGYDAKRDDVFTVIRRPTVDAIAEHARTVERVSCSGWSGPTLTLPTAAGPAMLSTVEVCADLPDTLGVRPVAGRTFATQEGEPGADNVGILFHDAWQHYFGGDPTVVGRTVIFEERPIRVIGILPPTFVLAPTIESTQGTAMLLPTAPPRDAAARRRAGAVAVGRLRPGVSLARAQAEIDSLDRGVQGAEGRRPIERRVKVVPLQAGMFVMIRPVSILLVAAAAMVLLLATVNLANLLLARGAWRERELAIRGALGAGRWRLVRQLLVEGLVLACVGGAAALLVGRLTYSALYALVPDPFKVLPSGIDARVVLFTVVVSVMTGIVAGAIPALRLTGRNLAPALQDSRRPGPARSTVRFRGKLLVAVETALTIVLLSAAGLMVNSLVRAVIQDLGVRPQGVVSLSAIPPRSIATKVGREAFSRQVRDALSDIPGVTAVARVASPTVASGLAPWAPMLWDGPRKQAGRRYYVDPEYFKVMGIPVKHGRGFTRAESDAGEHVAVVSEAAARRLWPGANAVGQIFQTAKDAPTLVVGVVGDTRDSYDRPVEPAIYLPPDSSAPFTYFVALTNGDIGATERLIRERVEGALRPQSVEVSSLSQNVRSTTASVEFRASLLSLFAALALGLSAVGIYGVVAYTVSHRTREMGIRVALGATRAELTSLIVRQSLVPVAAGGAAGLAGAFWLTRFLTKMLFEVKPTDPGTFAAAMVVLLAVAALACYGPARRAGRVDPVVALRAE